jgi:hypothetical protein
MTRCNNRRCSRYALKARSIKSPAHFRSLRLSLGAVLAVTAWLLWVGPLYAESLSIETISETSLPPDLAAARDVRWSDQGRLLLAIVHRGVVRVDYAEGKLGSQSLLIPEGSPPGIVVPAHLASTKDILAVASGASEMLWRSLLPGGGEGRLGEWWSEDAHQGITFFEDIDVRERDLVVLGLMRSAHRMGPDGAIAWRTVLGEPNAQLVPVLYSLAGPGARPFQACALFGIGHARFFPDGRLLIVPGAEPGILVLSSGNLPVKSWDTTSIGVDVDCNFPDQKLYLFAANEAERWKYLSQFSFIDAALPTEQGVLLFVKAAASGGRSRWTAILERDGEPSLSLPLPWESSSPYDRLSADIQAGRLILLISEVVPNAPPRAGKLIEVRMKVSGEHTPALPASKNSARSPAVSPR